MSVVLILSVLFFNKYKKNVLQDEEKTRMSVVLILSVFILQQIEKKCFPG